MDRNRSFLGTGWSFPPTFTKNGVLMTSDIRDIEGSLEILFSTRVNERFLQPEYGCGISELVFDPLNVSISDIKILIEEAIAEFEPRILLQDITITPFDSHGYLELEIEYLILSTNSRHNFVYPFYINEGI